MGKGAGGFDLHDCHQTDGKAHYAGYGHVNPEERRQQLFKVVDDDLIYHKVRKVLK